MLTILLCLSMRCHACSILALRYIHSPALRVSNFRNYIKYMLLACCACCNFSLLQARYCMYGSIEAGATGRVAQVSDLLRVRRGGDCIILRILNSMKCSCCFAYLLKTVASICEYLLHYSLLHLHDHWGTFGLLHLILPPAPRLWARLRAHLCLFRMFG